MAYRNGTYVAFDGLGQINPTLSDFKYYATIQAWASNKKIDFQYVDSHEKTYAVMDSSKRSTLESRIQERLSKSKNMLVILSSDTRKKGSMLSFEIEQAVDNYKIPLIMCYVDYKVVANPYHLSEYWPNAFATRQLLGLPKAIHIPFIKEAILDAIDRCTVFSKKVTSPNNIFQKHMYCSFGLLMPYENFNNSKK